MKAVGLEKHQPIKNALITSFIGTIERSIIYSFIHWLSCLVFAEVPLPELSWASTGAVLTSCTVAERKPEATICKRNTVFSVYDEEKRGKKKEYNQSCYWCSFSRRISAGGKKKKKCFRLTCWSPGFCSTTGNLLAYCFVVIIIHFQLLVRHIF